MSSLINQNDNLIEKLIPILENKGLTIPSKQDLILLLENKDLNKMFQFFLDQYETNTINKIIKKKVNFYFLNQNEIEKYFKLIDKKISLQKEI